MRTPTLAPWILAGLALGATAQDSASPTDEELHAAWEALPAEKRFEAMEWFRLEASVLGTFQQGLIEYAHGLLEDDPGLFPLAERPAWFDPSVHAPAQVIPRQWLSETSPTAIREREKLTANTADPLLVRAYVYDWGEGRIERVGGIDEIDRDFANAVRGLPPGTDLAEAIVESLLDDGTQRAEHAAFAHAYTDRVGRVYPGVTLYDAFSSGSEVEAPDVDALGIVHTLNDDWSSWVAPVPAGQQRALYRAVEELFVPARRHRSLRQALARTYLRGSAVPDDSYRDILLTLQAMWDENGSTPATLSTLLSESADVSADRGGTDAWSAFLETWNERIADESDLAERGNVRWAAIEADRARVRATLVWVLRQLGALETETERR